MIARRKSAALILAVLAILIGGACAGLGAAMGVANPALRPIFIGLMQELLGVPL